MSNRLNDYLDKKGAKILDEGVWKEYETEMKEKTVPAIEEKLKKSQQRAPELRFFPRRRRNADK